MTKRKTRKVKNSLSSSVKMRPRLMSSDALLIPPFLGEKGCDITFVVNNSNNMRGVLGSVKRLLIHTLLTKASLSNSLFNIMTFSSKVNLWSHHMLPCAPDTVYTALTWIHSVSCSPGRDLLAALSMALTDPSCQAVHLLCSGPPEQPEAVLRALPALAAGRPVNIFYLQDSGTQPHRNTRDYMQCLAEATSGSCYLIPFDPSGGLKKAVPLHVAERPSSVPMVSPSTYCCPSTCVIAPDQHPTNPAFLRCSLSNSFCPGPSCLRSCDTLSWTQFFPGCRVLARRQVDSLYHQGVVIQQVQGCSAVWVVEFDHSGGAASDFTSSRRQLICSPDMVANRGTPSRPLVPGDAVLSPWEPDLRRYGPGRVVAATERRVHAEGVTSLRVLMWNSCVSLVPDGLVLPISAAHYDRIVRELQIPTSAPLQSCGWLCSHSSTCSPQLLHTTCCPSLSSSFCCSCPVTHHQVCVASPSCSSSFGRMEDFDKAEHDTQLDLREEDTAKSDPETQTSFSSSLSEDETGASSSPEGKLRGDRRRPPWRYWRRTGPEPQHRQPGSMLSRRTPQPATFMFTFPQSSPSPNHSSMFQSLPGAAGIRATGFKPRPPAGPLQFPSNKANIIYT